MKYFQEVLFTRVTGWGPQDQALCCRAVDLNLAVDARGPWAIWFCKMAALTFEADLLSDLQAFPFANVKINVWSVVKRMTIPGASASLLTPRAKGGVSEEWRTWGRVQLIEEGVYEAYEALYRDSRSESATRPTSTDGVDVAAYNAFVYHVVTGTRL